MSSYWLRSNLSLLRILAQSVELASLVKLDLDIGKVSAFRSSYLPHGLRHHVSVLV